MLEEEEESEAARLSPFDLARTTCPRLFPIHEIITLGPSKSSVPCLYRCPAPILTLCTQMTSQTLVCAHSPDYRCRTCVSKIGLASTALMMPTRLTAPFLGHYYPTSILVVCPDLVHTHTHRVHHKFAPLTRTVRPAPETQWARRHVFNTCWPEIITVVNLVDLLRLSTIILINCILFFLPFNDYLVSEAPSALSDGPMDDGWISAADRTVLFIQRPWRTHKVLFPIKCH